MGKIYFDASGRKLRDIDVLRDLMGRNREAAMRELGVTQTREQRPFELEAEPLSVDGKKKVRVRRRSE